MGIADRIVHPPSAIARPDLSLNFHSSFFGNCGARFICCKKCFPRRFEMSASSTWTAPVQ